jgi:hypothetical protein
VNKAKDIHRYEYDAGDRFNHCEGAHLIAAWRKDGTQLTDEELEQINDSDEFSKVFYGEICIDVESSAIDKEWDSFKDDCYGRGEDPMEIMANR